MGGGNFTFKPGSMGQVGLSPRGRGKRINANELFIGERSIPAWAGETHKVRQRRQGRGVYPRVGGGNSALRWQALQQ